METHRKHIPVWQFKKAQRLDKQAEKIKHLMEDINAFNVGKKREEVLEALAVWLPQAEKFLAQTKSSQEYIEQLTDRNSELAQELMSKDERYSELSIEAAYMRHTLDSQQRLIDTIPKEVLEEIKHRKGAMRVR
jgi:DNA polymerase III delta prime subunit